MQTLSPFASDLSLGLKDKGIKILIFWKMKQNKVVIIRIQQLNLKRHNLEVSQNVKVHLLPEQQMRYF